MIEHNVHAICEKCYLSGYGFITPVRSWLYMNRCISIWNEDRMVREPTHWGTGLCSSWESVLKYCWHNLSMSHRRPLQLLKLIMRVSSPSIQRVKCKQTCDHVNKKSDVLASIEAQNALRNTSNHAGFYSKNFWSSCCLSAADIKEKLGQINY